MNNNNEIIREYARKGMNDGFNAGMSVKGMQANVNIALRKFSHEFNAQHHNTITNYEMYVFANKFEQFAEWVAEQVDNSDKVAEYRNNPKIRNYMNTTVFLSKIRRLCNNARKFINKRKGKGDWIGGNYGLMMHNGLDLIEKIATFL